MSELQIAGKRVGKGHPPFIIAEVAQAHDGNLNLAHAFIDAIAATGADAVKFQTHIAEAETSPAEPWRVKFSRVDASRYDYWKRMEFSAEAWAGLKAHAEEQGLVFLSSPFSDEAVDLLDGLGMAAWKIASGEVSNLPMLRRIAATGRPVLLSSGMSPWEELDAAVAVLREAGTPFAIFQCTTAYPCPPEQLGLNVLAEIAHRYDCPVGLSDHSATIYPGLAAVALGAGVLEVHATFHRNMFGPDVSSSLTMEELSDLVRGGRAIASALANPVDKQARAAEMKPLRDLFTKSVVAARDLSAGHVLAEPDLARRKPGLGIPAARQDELVGRTLKTAVTAGAPIDWSDLV